MAVAVFVTRLVAGWSKDYAMRVWYGIVAPSGTPPEIVNKLHQTIATVLADPKMVARLAELGGEPMPLSPADFGKLIVDDTEKWAKVIKGAGLKIE